MAKKSCPTCAAITAVLAASGRVPKGAAKKIGYSRPVRTADKAVKTTRIVRKVSDYQKKLSKHLKKERAKATKKNGDFRKGYNQARVMAAAHKCVKKEMRKR